MTIEQEVAENRRDVRRQASFFREPARQQTQTERLPTIPIAVSVSGEIETRRYGDRLIGGSPTTAQAAPAAAGGPAGTFSTAATLSGEWTRDGRRALVEAAAGGSIGLEQAALGSGDDDPTAADDALVSGLELTDAFGRDTGTATVQAQARLGALIAPTDLSEAGIYDGDGRLLARLQPDSDVTLSADAEVRLTVDIEFAGDTDDNAAVTDLAVISDLPRSEADRTETFEELALGTDDTAPATGDTSLGNEVVSKTTLPVRGRDTVRLSALLDAPEPAGQPYDLAEAGLRDADTGTLLTRQVVPVIQKDDRVRVRLLAAVEFR